MRTDQEDTLSSFQQAHAGEDESLEQDDSSESEEEQDANDSDEADEEKLYAGKFKTPEELEASYQEIQRFVGGRKELEAKAAEFDRIVAKDRSEAAARSQLPLPKLSSHVKEDGTIDVAAYDEQMAKYQTQQLAQVGSIADQKTREATDIQLANQNFPYLVSDERAARTVMALYRSGEATSIYEAAKLYDADRTSHVEQTAQRAGAEAKNELSKKSRGNTERPNAASRRDTGEMTPEKFARMTRVDQKKYIEQQMKDSWNTHS